MAIQTQFLPPPGKDFNDAKRQYAEQFGSSLVTNMYLRIAVLCLALVSAGLLFLNFKTYALFRGFKPLVIRINDVGRAEPLQYAFEIEKAPRTAAALRSATISTVT